MAEVEHEDENEARGKRLFANRFVLIASKGFKRQKEAFVLGKFGIMCCTESSFLGKQTPTVCGHHSKD